MKRILAVLLCVCLLVSLVGCGASNTPGVGTSGTITKAPATAGPDSDNSAEAKPSVRLPDFANEMPTPAPVQTMSPEPTPEPTVHEADPQTETVYWVPKGKVWHTTPDCSTLSRSKTILSGTIEESGKPRVCKKCG